ncbi:DNA polymerase Y family protein [Xylophilus sp. GW821-FHT01B05]
MHWIALQPWAEAAPATPDLLPLAWWALQFTPRVARLDEALLLEVSVSERLWGGRQQLLQQLLAQAPLEAVFGAADAAGHLRSAQGPTGLLALARLRLGRGDAPDALPIATLSAAAAHASTLAHMGCRTWRQLRALPRAGLARRFGAALLDALDTAYGERPEHYPWCTLPETFDTALELPALATSAPELMWSAHRLLAQLQVWLQARQRGVRAFELEWTLDLRRMDGVDLPRHGQLLLRTAQPTRDMAYLRRLTAEHLARSVLQAPANRLRLRSIDTDPWAGAATSLLPGEETKGDRLHQLVERLQARLGADRVQVPVLHADHRPECRQQWVPAGAKAAAGGGLQEGSTADALAPPWLLPQPLPLAGQDLPQYHGPLRLLCGPQRIESGWWCAPEERALRDYFIAESEEAGLLWVFREHPPVGGGAGRWFLQGFYA